MNKFFLFLLFLLFFSAIVLTKTMTRHHLERFKSILLIQSIRFVVHILLIGFYLMAKFPSSTQLDSWLTSCTVPHTRQLVNVLHNGIESKSTTCVNQTSDNATLESFIKAWFIASQGIWTEIISKWFLLVSLTFKTTLEPKISPKIIDNRISWWTETK